MVWSASNTLAVVIPPFGTEERSRRVVMEQNMHDMVTDRIRARITEGASRESVAEGRVEEEV